MMLLTTCAACAKPIDHDASSRCVACETRYCSDRCQRYDRRRGGHGKICGAIASGGGAEQHYANKKYEEAAAEADVGLCACDGYSNPVCVAIAGLGTSAIAMPRDISMLFGVYSSDMMEKFPLVFRECLSAHWVRMEHR